MRYLTLSWDDGFKKSSIETAEIFEKHGLRAEFNVLATAHLDDDSLVPPMRPEGQWESIYGDFKLWNDLQARGHVIQPHGYDHTDKSSIPFSHAKDLILKCLDIFGHQLDGFEPKQAIFNFPYNASTPQIETWLPTVVHAFRTGGHTLNPLPTPDTVKLTTTGWEDAEPWLDRCLDDLLARSEGWLIYNTHGLDGEGWGPVGSDYLDRLLKRLKWTTWRSSRHGMCSH